MSVVTLYITCLTYCKALSDRLGLSGAGRDEVIAEDAWLLSSARAGGAIVASMKKRNVAPFPNTESTCK